MEGTSAKSRDATSLGMQHVSSIIIVFSLGGGRHSHEIHGTLGLSPSPQLNPISFFSEFLFK